MADQTEINRAVHEAMGKCWHEIKQESVGADLVWRCQVCRTMHVYHNPGYCSSLDLVAEFEKFVREHQEDGDIHLSYHLMRVLELDGYDPARLSTSAHFASAEQRAKAGLAALNIEVKG